MAYAVLGVGRVGQGHGGGEGGGGGWGEIDREGDFASSRKVLSLLSASLSRVTLSP